MDFYGLILDYALEERLNYVGWKDCMDEMLEDNGLKKLIDNIPKLAATDT